MNKNSGRGRTRPQYAGKKTMRRRIRLAPMAVAMRRINNKVASVRRSLNRGGNMGNKIATRSIIQKPGLSADGLAFLKCAFAPPDFAETQVKGIPDNYRGKTLLKKHRYTAPFTVLPSLDYYLLLLPTPGIAFWYLTTATGVKPDKLSVWTAVAYSDIAQLFPNANDAANIVNNYRYVSNHFELISTTNAMLWTGAIETFKLNPTLIQRTGTTDMYSITGLNGVNSTQNAMYSGPSVKGVYLGCYNAQADFPFQPVLEGIMTGKVPAVIGTSDWGMLDAVGVQCFPGFYNGFESACIKMTGMTSTNTFILKTWACVEYQVVPTSTLVDYTQVSPQLDAVALRAYREIMISLPISVTSAENEAFWRRVLTILRAITSVGSRVPGPYGMISGGANAVLSGINTLTL